MIMRATEWMSGRWWVALAVVMSFILVARTGTVGAPAEAHPSGGVDGTGRIATSGPEFLTPTPGANPVFLALERHVRYLEGEIVALQDALTLERVRAEILESSYRDLETQFSDLARSVRGLAEASSPRDMDSNQPIHATSVRGIDFDTDRTTTNDR